VAESLAESLAECVAENLAESLAECVAESLAAFEPALGFGARGLRADPWEMRRSRSGGCVMRFQGEMMVQRGVGPQGLDSEAETEQQRLNAPTIY